MMNRPVDSSPWNESAGRLQNAVQNWWVRARDTQVTWVSGAAAAAARGISIDGTPKTELYGEGDSKAVQREGEKERFLPRASVFLVLFCPLFNIRVLYSLQIYRISRSQPFSPF